jgi:hypothetical protein
MAAFEHSGLAGEIRAAISSEQYDLTNYTQQRAHDFIVAAFGTPLDAPTEMIRCTFVVGGGKLVRAKYDDELPKWVGGALREIGFEEDRSAAVDFSCQGTFKQQHDTGQNLKTIAVFPRVTCADAKAEAEAPGGKSGGFSTNTPEYIIAACELSTFQEVVAAKAPSWAQKKKMLKTLQDVTDKFKAVEGKLIRGEPLSEEDQARYDSNSGQDEQKVAWLQGEIKGAVEHGQLTARERAEVVLNMDTNIAALNSEIEKAKADSKPKKVLTLEERLKALNDKKTALSAIKPLTHHRLRMGDEILKLRLKLCAFAPLEEKQRMGGMTLAELKQLEPKFDIEANVASLEQASRGWFDDEEDFKLSCEYEAKAAKAKYAAKMKPVAKKKASGSSSSSGTARPAARSGGGGFSIDSIGVKKAPVAKKAPASFASAFGGDDDSDSDN